ncbi:hypothetical protein JZU48_01725, partial [bacterium]|nr:hypothetical protein [bacterium]
PIRERLPAEPIPPHTRFVKSTRVYSFTNPIEKVAKIDHRLSHLCQRGAFTQLIDGFYWAETPDRRLGVAFSGGANLSTPQDLRKKGEVYFFDGQDAVCTVYVAKQQAVMDRFVAPGSRLPIAGPSGIPAPSPVKTPPPVPSVPAPNPGGRPSR